MPSAADAGLRCEGPTVSSMLRADVRSQPGAVGSAAEPTLTMLVRGASLPMTGTEVVMASAGPETVVRELIDAFSATDWPRFEGLLAQNVVYSETGTGRRVEGVQAYIELCRGWETGLPRYRRRPWSHGCRQGQRGPTGCLEGDPHRALAHAAGDLEASGNHVEVEGCMWCLVSDSRVTDVLHFLDVFGLLQQVGALPAGERREP
jgi:ketosteroid isomerase-like protein